MAEKAVKVIHVAAGGAMAAQHISNRVNETGAVTSNPVSCCSTSGCVPGWLSVLLFHAYGLTQRRSIRALLRRIIIRLEGGRCGDLYSVTLRRIFKTYHGIDVGYYTGRGAFVVGNYPGGTTIGRYCSIHHSARAFGADHPMNLRSTHAFFYNPHLGIAKADLLHRTKLTIGHDVWIGHNAIILSPVSEIGNGAVIGAGAVVHQNVAPYAIVVGNPARVVRYRFSPHIIDSLQASRWWQRPIDELLTELDAFQHPLDGDSRVR